MEPTMRLLLAAAMLATASPAPAGDLSPELAAKLLAWASSEHASGADRCSAARGASIGMDAAGVLKSCWGAPLRVNSTTTGNGRHEQWIYAGGALHFDNGVVTAIQAGR